MGDGHRLCRVLYRFIMIDYATSNSTHYLPETIRMLLQTDPKAGLCSPRMSQRIMYDRFVNRKGGPNSIDIDLGNEYDNRDIKPSIVKLGEDHAKEDAAISVKQKRKLMKIRRAQFESVGARQAHRDRKVRTRKAIMKKIPALVRMQNLYNGAGVVMTGTKQNKKFCLRPMRRVNLLKLSETVQRELNRNQDWNKKRANAKVIDAAYLAAALAG
jgi:hypothetical protein